MGRRRRYLPWIVCATLAAAGVPALALGQADPPSSASVVVSDTGFAPGDRRHPRRRQGELQLPVRHRRLQRRLGSRQPRAGSVRADPRRRSGATARRSRGGCRPRRGPATARSPGPAPTRTTPAVDPNKMKGTVVVHADATPTATPTVTATPTATPTRRPRALGDRRPRPDRPRRNWFQDAAGRRRPTTRSRSQAARAGRRSAIRRARAPHNVVFRTAPTSWRA